MKAGPLKLDFGSDSSASNVSGPLIVVTLIILLGATVFLWRARYIRRKTAYVTLAVLTLVLLLICWMMYSAGL